MSSEAADRLTVVEITDKDAAALTIARVGEVQNAIPIGIGCGAVELCARGHLTIVEIEGNLRIRDGNCWNDRHDRLMTGSRSAWTGDDDFEFRAAIGRSERRRGIACGGCAVNHVSVPEPFIGRATGIAHGDGEGSS